jgi:phage terminase large subunit
MNEVKIIDLINPVFYDFWLNEKPNNILKGGRSSMKSSVISLKLVLDFLNDPQGNVVVLRKVAKYLSTSVYQQVTWAIYMLKLENQFYFGKSPLIIRHKATGTAFYFYGVDDPMKIKSAKIAKGYVMALWFEELAEFSGVTDIDVVQDTFIRQDLGEKEVKTYFSYNPPRNPYAWVNEWLEARTNNPDYFIHHSTYLDDEKGFLADQLLRKIENYKVTDTDYWEWMYNGKVIGLGNMVYNIAQFKKIPELPANDDLLLIDIAVDTGYQVSATTFLAFGLTKRQDVILLDTYYYSPENKAVKKAPSDLSVDFKNWYDNLRQTYRVPIDKLTIDSADGAMRPQIYKDYGMTLHPVAKKKNIDMIDYVQNLLSQQRFYVLDTPNNRIFYEEHKKYQWDESTLHSADPRVIKIDDHTCDAFKYYIMDNRIKLQLRV